MKYSVLMSVYFKENPQFLRQSLNSMFEQGSVTDDFVLVADGELTDELYAVIDEYEKKYSEIFSVVQLEKNVGLGQALNAGLQKCKNDIVARMDSDDISLPDRCEKQLAEFEKNPELDILSGTLHEFDGSTDNIIAVKKLPGDNKEIREYAKKRSPFNHPCVMYKKKAVIDAGGYQHFLWFEDYYLWIRMLKNGAKAFNIESPLLLMRAGDDMYKRRGGIKYLKQMIKFRKYMYSVNFCNLFEFIYTVISQSFICVLPNSIRIKIYRKLLRG